MENKSIVCVIGDAGLFDIVIRDNNGIVEGVRLEPSADARDAMEFSAKALMINPTVLYPFEQITSLDPAKMLEQFKTTMYERLRDKKSTRPGLLKYNIGGSCVMLACDGVTEEEPEPTDEGLTWRFALFTAVDMPINIGYKCFQCNAEKTTHTCIRCKQRIWCSRECRSAGSKCHRKFCDTQITGTLAQAALKCDCCSFHTDGSILMQLIRANELMKVSMIAITLYAHIMDTGQNLASCPRSKYMRELLLHMGLNEITRVTLGETGLTLPSRFAK